MNTLSATPSRSHLLRRLDVAIEVILFGMLAWLPLAFGGVLPASHAVVLVGTATMTVLLGLRLALDDTQYFRWSWAYLPMALFLGLVALQLAPLPEGLIDVLAPGTAADWRVLLAEPPPPEGMPGAFSLSFYPHGTATDLRLLCAGALLLVVIANTFRERGPVKRLLGWIAIVGGVVALEALLQTLSGTGSLLWIWPQNSGPATAGPFVHYGHFSQFVNLSAGAALGLMLVRLGERGTGGDRHTAKELVSDLLGPGRRVDLLLLLFVLVGIVAIALSHSRNGVISMAVGGAIAAGLMHGTRFLRGMGWPMGVLALIALVTVLAVGFDPVYDRMAETLEDPVEAASTRLTLARDSIEAAAAFPVVGAGQGAFEYVFPVFDASERGGRAQHAENQYLEVLVETGAVGVALILAFVALVALPWLARMRKRQGFTDAALFGLLFGVVAVAFHATTDFGLRIPAVAVLTTVCLGVVIGRSAKAVEGRAARIAAAVICFGEGALLLAFVPAVLSAHEGDEAWRAAVRIDRQAQKASGAERMTLLDQKVAHLEQAATAQPGHAEYSLLWANALWDRAVLEHGPDPSKPGEPLSAQQIESLTAAAQRSFDILSRARVAAPTYGMIWTMLGQFGVQWLGKPEAASWVLRGAKFSPESPQACEAAARQLLSDGDEAGAVRMFVRALRVGASSAAIFQAIAIDLARIDIAREVARGDPRWLLRLSQTLARIPEQAELVKELRSEARGLMEQRCAEPEPPSWMLANIAQISREDGDEDNAIAFYRRYLAAVPNGTARLDLARLLEKRGDRDGAVQELRRLINFRPDYESARRMLRELSAR